jgi:hypothetical protein
MCDSIDRQIAAIESDRSIPCFFPWLQLEERTLDGQLKVCCWTPEIVGISPKSSDRSLIEIWRESGVQEMQRSMLDGTFHRFCPDSCPLLSWRREPCKDTFYRYDPAEYAEFSSAFKENRAKVVAAIQSRTASPMTYPLRLKLHPSSVCNLACTMCHLDLRERVQTGARYLEKVHAMMPFLEELKIFGGEPFACRTSRQIMFGEQLRKHPQIHLSVVTNGTLIDEKTRERLSALRLGWFEFSLDGCTQKTYESIRIKGKHSRTFSNVEAFVAERDKNNLRIDEIYISFVVQRRNYHEIGEFVRYATQLGVTPVFGFVMGGDELVGLTDEVRSCLQEGIGIAESLENAQALDNLSGLLHRLAAYEKSVKSHRRRQEVKKALARVLGSQRTAKLVRLVRHENLLGRARLRPDS